MWRITAADGRVAWYCSDGTDALAVMVDELFGGGEKVRVDEVAPEATESQV